MSISYWPLIITLNKNVTSLMNLLSNSDNSFNLDSLVSKSSSDVVIYLVALEFAEQPLISQYYV